MGAAVVRVGRRRRRPLLLRVEGGGPPTPHPFPNPADARSFLTPGIHPSLVLGNLSSILILTKVALTPSSTPQMRRERELEDRQMERDWWVWVVEGGRVCVCVCGGGGGGMVRVAGGPAWCGSEEAR